MGEHVELWSLFLTAASVTRTHMPKLKGSYWLLGAE